MRIHGCLPPFSSLQIIAWVLLVLLTTIFFTIFVQVLPLGWNFLAYIKVVGGGTLVSSVLGLVITTTNPADPNVLKKDPYFSKRATSFVVPRGKKVIDETSFCCLCQVQVKQKSKHCRLCDKCVDTFDHHCKWLNNCIGKRNYTVFLIYLSLLFITTLSYCISGAYIFVAYFVDRHAIVQRLHSHYQNFEPTLLVTIVGVCSVFVSCIFCLVSQLFFFHIKIAFFQHITTYEYILRQRAVKEERRQALAIPGKAVPLHQLEKNGASLSREPSSAPPSARSSLSLNLRRIGSSPRVAPLPTPLNVPIPTIPVLSTMPTPTPSTTPVHSNTPSLVWGQPDAPVSRTHYAQEGAARAPVIISSSGDINVFVDTKVTFGTTPRGYNLPANAKLETLTKLPHIESPNLGKLPELDTLQLTKGMPLPSAHFDRTSDESSDASTKSIQFVTTTMTTTTTTTTTTTFSPFSSTPRRSSLGVLDMDSHIHPSPSPRRAPSPSLSPHASVVLPPSSPLAPPSPSYPSPPSLSFTPPPPVSPRTDITSPRHNKQPLPPIRSSLTFSVT